MPIFCSPLEFWRAEIVALAGLHVMQRELPLQLLLAVLRGLRAGDRHRGLGKLHHVAAGLK